MLFLLFQLGKDHYALDAGQVAKVLPDARGLIRLVEVNKLLPASVRDVLFKQPVES